MKPHILLIDMNPAGNPGPVYPLGPAMLADSAGKAGIDVKCASWADFGRDRGAFSELLSENDYSLIGVSLRNIDNTQGINTEFYLPLIFPHLTTLAEGYREKTILGGAGFSLFPETILRVSGLKYGIVKSVFEKWMEILRLLIENNGHPDPSELDKIIRNQDSEYSSALMDLPGPDKFATGKQEWKRVGFDTRKGCSRNCVYCVYPEISGKNFEKRPVDEITEYLDRWKDIGYAYFDIVDDVFNDDTNHCTTICEGLAAKENSVELSASVRPCGITTELAALMKSGGLNHVELGADSLFDSVLDELRKGFHVEDIDKAVKEFKKAGIKTSVNLILGSEFDSCDTVSETIRNVNLIGPDRVTAQYGIRIYPGTDMQKKYRRKNHELLEPLFSLSETITLEECRRQFENGIDGSIIVR